MRYFLGCIFVLVCGAGSPATASASANKFGETTSGFTTSGFATSGFATIGFNKFTFLLVIFWNIFVIWGVYKLLILLNNRLNHVPIFAIKKKLLLSLPLEACNFLKNCIYLCFGNSAAIYGRGN